MIWRLKKREIDPPISASSVRKGGPVNWRWAIRDFRSALVELWIVATAPDGPVPPPTRSRVAKCGGESPIDRAISTKPLARRLGAYKRGIKSSLAARSIRIEGPVKRRGVPEISVGRWGGGVAASLRRAARPAFRAIIAEKGDLFLTPSIRR